MTWQADKPYNDLPPLPPLQDVETKAIFYILLYKQGQA